MSPTPDSPHRGTMCLRVKLLYCDSVASATSNASNHRGAHSPSRRFPAAGSMNVPRRRSTSISAALSRACSRVVKPVSEPCTPSSVQYRTRHEPGPTCSANAPVPSTPTDNPLVITNNRHRTPALMQPDRLSTRPRMSIRTHRRTSASLDQAEPITVTPRDAPTPVIDAVSLARVAPRQPRSHPHPQRRRTRRPHARHRPTTSHSHHHTRPRKDMRLCPSTVGPDPSVRNSSLDHITPVQGRSSRRIRTQPPHGHTARCTRLPQPVTRIGPVLRPQTELDRVAAHCSPLEPDAPGQRSEPPSNDRGDQLGDPLTIN